MPDIEISQCYEAQGMAEELIPQYHPHLQRAKIAYLLTTQKRKRANRVVLGSAAKLSALVRYFSSGDAEDVDDGYDFLVLISSMEWAFLTKEGRVALVDHELSHCSERVTVNLRTGDVHRTWTLIAHDVEEFQGVLERHGFWRRDLRQFGHVAQQLPLVDAEPGDHPTLFDASAPATAAAGAS